MDFVAASRFQSRASDIFSAGGDGGVILRTHKAGTRTGEEKRRGHANADAAFHLSHRM